MTHWNFLILASVVSLAASLGFSQDGGSDEAQAVYKLGSVTAAPGETVRVPFSIWSNRDMQWAICCVRFDETVLEPVGVEPVYKRPDGESLEWCFICAKISNCQIQEPGWAAFYGLGWLRTLRVSFRYRACRGGGALHGPRLPSASQCEARPDGYPIPGLR